MKDTKHSDLEKILLAARPFRYLDIKELNTLITYCKLINFANGKTVFHQGKKSEGMYVIIKGKALLIAKTLWENEIELATLEQGNFIGEISLIEKGLCPASIIAKGELKCLLLPTSYFDMLGIFFPETKYKIVKAITEEVSERIRYWSNHILKLMKRSHATRTTPTEIKKHLISPESITFQEAKIDLHELINSSFFKIFNKDEFEKILKNSELIKAPTFCPLINNGEENAFFIILYGAVQSSIFKNDKVAKLAVLGPMSLFGSTAYIDGVPSVINYTTHERAILLKIPVNHLTRIQKNDLTLFYKLFDLICESFVILNKSAQKLHIRLHIESYK